ncbi:Ref family recombination enhancement nuclease, partial [Escherichia coli]
KQKERPPASKTRKSAVKIKSRGLKGRTPTAEERTIANALGTLPCIACYMHGVISEEVSLHHISGRTAPGCHKKQLPLCRWHHQHAAPAEVREKYPWLVPVH